MIINFADKDTESVWQRRRGAKRIDPRVVDTAYRKLVALDSVTTLAALAAVRGNNLKALKGDLKGKYSIRINDQWRIVFTWSDRGYASGVSITDYH